MDKQTTIGACEMTKQYPTIDQGIVYTDTVKNIQIIHTGKLYDIIHNGITVKTTCSGLHARRIVSRIN